MINSSRTTIFGKIVTRPSKVVKLSIRANEFQLCCASVLLTDEALMQERTTFLNRGSKCLIIKFSPRRPPKIVDPKVYHSLGRILVKNILIISSQLEFQNTNSNQCINSISTMPSPKTAN